MFGRTLYAILKKCPSVNYAAMHLKITKTGRETGADPVIPKYADSAPKRRQLNASAGNAKIAAGAATKRHSNSITLTRKKKIFGSAMSRIKAGIPLKWN